MQLPVADSFSVEGAHCSPFIFFVPSILVEKLIKFLFLKFCSVPELLVLNDCDIDKAGEPEDLQKKCSSVKELDLAQNKLQNWNEVFTILSHMPRVEFVNLSLNRLSGLVDRPQTFDCGMSRIRNLVLNNTRLDWESVETIINMLPVLEELHLSLNNYSNVLIDTLDDFDLSDTEMDIDCGGNEQEVEESMCTCGNDTDAITPICKRSKVNIVMIFVSNFNGQFLFS